MLSNPKECLRSFLYDCKCFRWSCWQHWRLWCKPLMVVFYLVVLLVLLPVFVLWLYQENAADQFKAWFVAGIFMLLTVPIFLIGLMQHLMNYTQPHLQAHIIRVLWIVPIYSIDSWLGLRFPVTAVYWNTLRECYESYVLYNFLRYLLNFLEFEYELESELVSRPPVGQPIPFCCCPTWPNGLRFIKRCKFGVLQYTVVRVLLTSAALITQVCGVYDAGQLRLDRSYVYLQIMNAISQMIALHSLIYFYKGTRDLLKPLRPIWKFLSIKIIIFATFWQSVLVVVLVKTHALPPAWTQHDMENVALSLQNFLICIEMLLIALAHYFVFSHKPFVDPAAAQVPCITSCLRMLDLRDVYGDVREHFVDPLPRPKLPKRLRRRRRKKRKIEDGEDVTGDEVEEEEEEEEEESEGGDDETKPLLWRNGAMTRPLPPGLGSLNAPDQRRFESSSFSMLSYGELASGQRPARRLYATGNAETGRLSVVIEVDRSSDSERVPDVTDVMARSAAETVSQTVIANGGLSRRRSLTSEGLASHEGGEERTDTTPPPPVLGEASASTSTSSSSSSSSGSSINSSSVEEEEEDEEEEEEMAQGDRFQQ